MITNQRKGIILAGGTGTRLAPLTQIFTKHLLPVYDKPMIYYPLSLLMLAGIQEILIISDEENLPLIKKFLGNGSMVGLCLSYAVQSKPRGLAEAFIIAADFLDGASVCLALGDNILFGNGLSDRLKHASQCDGGVVFGIQVRDPGNYGVIKLDSSGKPVSIEEKPLHPKSNLAVPGLYFFDKDVVCHAQAVKPYPRGELEITSIIERYIITNQLRVDVLGRGYAWLDAGTHSSLLEASNFVEMIERRQAQKIGCIEEISYHKGWISEDELKNIALKYTKSGYGEYLLMILQSTLGERQEALA